jgi:hypothetical protein
VIAAPDLVRLAMRRLELGEKDAGENEPEYEATIKLLEIVGAIDVEALSDLPAEPEGEVIRKAQESLDAARAGPPGEQRVPRRGAA